MILDAGFLVAVDRGERGAQVLLASLARAGASLHTTHPVVAQVWRRGPRQARLAAFLKAVSVHPFDDGRSVGALLASSGTDDVVDAHLVILAVRLGEAIVTGDQHDLGVLCSALGPTAPIVHPLP